MNILKINIKNKTYLTYSKFFKEFLSNQEEKK